MNKHDRSILRDLAKRIAEIASLPIQEERRRLWKAHNSLKPIRPMILLFPEGGWGELLTEADLTCDDSEARRIEYALRQRIYHHEHFADDTVIEGHWEVRKAIANSGWGLTGARHESSEARGAWSFSPVLNDPADLEKLVTPTITHDQAETERRTAEAEELFGEILEIRPTGASHISYHLMQQYTSLRGLEQMMIDMFENPELLHATMRRLTDGHKDILRQYEKLNLLELNNNWTYHSSGGVGYTDELPAPGYDPAHVRPADMWASAESQELAQVGPAQHEEFALTYERELLAPFALNGYGCCEPLTDRMELVLSIPNIRRISISPWAHVDAAAEQLGPRAIFSWKPRPMDLVGEFHEPRIRSYIEHTVEVALRNNCALEMILKDTHTCEHHPERFDRWSEIAREVVGGATRVVTVR
ncbi:MAG: hypothetical protein ACLFNT_05080 [Spirochaetales bacterium]